MTGSGVLLQENLLPSWEKRHLLTWRMKEASFASQGEIAPLCVAPDSPETEHIGHVVLTAV